MNKITKISPRPLALLIATVLSGNVFAGDDDMMNDGEIMVVYTTAEEALKQQRACPLSPLKILKNHLR